MRRIVKEITGSWLLSTYLALSLLLSASPILVRGVIRASYDPADPYGSGADPFVWFYFVAWAFITYCGIQLVAFLVGRFGTVRAKVTVLLASLICWAASILWLL